MGTATQLLREFGFPTVVALWFMLRSDKRMDTLVTQLTALTTAIAVLSKSTEQMTRELQQSGVFPQPKEIEK